MSTTVRRATIEDLYKVEGKAELVEPGLKRRLYCTLYYRALTKPFFFFAD